MSIVDKANASAAPMPAASSVFITLMPIMGAVFVFSRVWSGLTL
jgi:hypothetical protein